MESWRLERLYRNIAGMMRHPRKSEVFHPLKYGALMDAEQVLRHALGLDFEDFLEIGRARSRGLRAETHSDGFIVFKNAGWDRVPVVPKLK